MESNRIIIALEKEHLYVPIKLALIEIIMSITDEYIM